MRPNERFSGRNHSRHLCRECSKLPTEEREYRQGERDIERLLRGLYVSRKHKARFNQFLGHPITRVRELATTILAEEWRQAEERRRMRDEEEAWYARVEHTLSESPDVAAETGTAERPRTRSSRMSEDDVPF
jgi:hypothetical protein